ncbi:MAG: TonB-dependent receptor [Proteobacteria bacterium]|nr:TonB-dependent receptor [Pseudomonadota bacterium]
MTPRIRSIVSCLLICLISPLQAEQNFTISDQSTNIRLRQEALQWTPESITIIKKSDLESSYFRDLEDIQGFAPGVIIDNLFGTPQGAGISMRGVGSSQNSKGFEPAVALSIDGVYVGTHASQMQVLFDIEQIEIARGPQMTYRGIPNTGGSINIVRSKPTGQYDVDVRASFGDYDHRELDAVINFPITDAIAGKVAFSWKDEGGDYLRNITNGRGENSEDRLAISGSLLWQLSDQVTAQYTYDNEDDAGDTPGLLNISTQTDLVCINAVSNETCGSSIGLAVPQTISFERTAQNFSNKRRYKGDHHTLRIDFEWADRTLTSITGFRNTEEKMDTDLDATQVDFYSISSEQDYEQFSQEFRLTEQYSENLHYALGFYYLSSQYDLFQEEFFILNALGNAGLGASHDAADVQWLTSSTESTYFSIFAHVDYVLDDQWTVDFGSRVSIVEKDFNHRPSGVRINKSYLPSPVNVSKNKDWIEWTFSAGISYQVDEEAMIYFRFSEGFRPGGFNENAVSVESATSYGSETTDNWELGMKSEWFNDKLRLNMAYYKIDLDNKQEQFIALVAPGRLESVIDNVATIETNGFELEFEAIPIENLYLRGTYNHMGADYKTYLVPDLANPGTELSLKGLRPNRAPKDTYFFSALYSFDFASGIINIYAGYRFSDDYQTNPKILVAKVNNHTTWDFSIDYMWRDWTFRLFSQNVKNKRYLQNVVNLTDADIVPLVQGATNATGLVTFAEYNRPRYTGFELIYRPDLSGLFN